jgi:hypothetical protein
MNLFEQPWGLLAIAFAASFFWRAAGAIVSGRIAVDTPLFDWCVCVTQAIVGGLMVRAILLPSTGLAQVPLTDRIAAALLGLAVFLLLRWRILPGVLVGVLTLAGLILWRAA